ncbi:MAG: thiamine pyrophosphate-binding protein [Burkholderiales bacterium]|nr:thiamine pyrophosphate-binding protein [Burkholderiales bacterium]
MKAGGVAVAGNAMIVPVYEALAQDIKAMGVEAVFGLMSDDTALFVAMLDSVGVRFHGARHENTAIGMAEGYAASSGKLGIAVIGRGPATANGMHGATYAQRTGSRVLIIVGEVSLAPVENGYGPDTKTFSGLAALQAAGYRPFVPASGQAARQTMAQAVAATRHGAQVLMLPANVQSEQVDTALTAPVMPPETPRTAGVPRSAAIAAAAGVLARCRRPLILAGYGAHKSGARDALVALAHHLGAGLATTLKAKDMFRGHPMDCGIVGSFSHAGGRRLIEQADCILVFGAGLNQRTSAMGTSLPKDATVIQVDLTRTHVGRWLHADVGVIGDATLVAEALLRAVPARAEADKEFHAPAVRDWLEKFELSSDFKPMHTARTVDARAAALALDAMLPQDRNVVYDAGNFLQVVPYVSVPEPSRIKQASDFASIGMGFGVAMGYARSAPGRTTVFFVGDGGFLMTMGELETVVRENIPLVIVVMNDCAYGAELHYLKIRGMPVAMSAFPDVDFAPVAAAFGFETATVRTMDELRALAPMLARPDGPVLIDCKINGAIAAPFLFEGKA